MFHSVSCMTVPNVQVLIYFVTQLLYSPPPAAGLHQAVVPIHLLSWTIT